jgi:AmpD protein
MKSFSIDDTGFATDVQLTPSNFDARPLGELSLIVIHNISLPPGQYGGNGIIELFTNQLNPSEHPFYNAIHTQKVSAHFLIRRNGHLIQFVSCLNRAWHAGASNWQGRERCNDFSVGIEIEGSDFDVFEPAQYLTLNTLLADLIKKYPIKAIVGHSDIAPVRKTDPGPYFDWSQVKTLST